MRDFSVVSYFDSGFTARVRALQERIAVETGARASLDIWAPHITIGSGISVPDEDVSHAKERLDRAVEDIAPFPIVVSGFGFMDDWSGGKQPGITPYVVYLRVVVPDSLRRLVESVRNGLTDHFDRWYEQPSPYKPHVTIAYRDLSWDGFLRAKDLLSREIFIAEPIIDHVSLVDEIPDAFRTEYYRTSFCFNGNKEF
ncbi:MAG: 2'-5' RNA ligase family protein [Candidatus Moranbacteria bacterium]|nr:2'-5' RNA ligase family protein [Candidatus Moranbacteria bacterium]